jgi:DNA-binding NtrC family response regulator
VIDAADLDAGIPQRQRSCSQPALGAVHSVTVKTDRQLSEIIRDVELAAIGDALEATQGRMDLAAKRLGISRKGLYLKRQRLDAYRKNG